jgi:LysR family cys regulon transcriptional activator
MTRAAAVLKSSQPGLSMQLRALEDEIGAEVLVRRRGRIVGLTQPGEAVIEVAKRMLRDADNLRKIGSGYEEERRGTLALGMTHTHARYGLIEIIDGFRRRYPDVQLILREASPPQVFDLVGSGAVDIALVNEIPADSRRLATFACPHSASNDLRRSVVVPAGHPLTKRRRLALKDIAAYPLIMMDNTTTGARAVLEAFSLAGIEPKIVMRANAPDVIKSYVALGFGIAVLPAVAYDRKTDRSLAALEASRLFGTGILAMALDPNAYLKGYMYDFMALVSPEWTREKVNARLNEARSSRSGRIARTA